MEGIEILKIVNQVVIWVSLFVVFGNFFRKIKTNKIWYGLLAIFYLSEAYVNSTMGKSYWVDIGVSLIWLLNFWITDKSEKIRLEEENKKPSK